MWKEIGMKLKGVERVVGSWFNSDHEWRREEDQVGWKHHGLLCNLGEVQESLQGTLEFWVDCQRIPGFPGMHLPQYSFCCLSLPGSCTRKLGSGFQSTAAGAYVQLSKEPILRTTAVLLVCTDLLHTNPSSSSCTTPTGFSLWRKTIKQEISGKNDSSHHGIQSQGHNGCSSSPTSLQILNFLLAQPSPKQVLVAYLVLWYKPSFQKVSHTLLSPRWLHMSTHSYNRPRNSQEGCKVSLDHHYVEVTLPQPAGQCQIAQPLWWLLFLPAGCQTQGIQRTLGTHNL